MQVVTQEQLQPFIEEIKKLREELEAVKAREQHRIAQPGPWLIQSEARELFIGRKGKPVERHTFQRMVNDWLKQKDLVMGVNYKVCGTVRFFSKEFLKGQPRFKEQTSKLRKAI